MAQQDLLSRIAEATRLREGSEGVRNFLRIVYQKQGISNKECSRLVRLPIPLVTALKKELIKEGIMLSLNGLRLSNKGEAFCQEQLGFVKQQDYLCMCCRGLRYTIPSEFDELLSKIEVYLNDRPKVNVTIDQSMCTPETSLRRALLATEYGVTRDSRVACIGDDDLVSISLALLHKHLAATKDQDMRVTVYDIDERFLDYIEGVAAEEDLDIETVHHDVRNPLPECDRGAFSAFFTDPPYTVDGGTLFVSRGVEALKSVSGLPVFLSFAHKDPAEMLALQHNLIQMGLAITEVLPRFNQYVGAEIIGNQSQMIVATTTKSTRPLIAKGYDEPIYTGEVSRTVRVYRCKKCGISYRIGADEDVRTIEELKTKGCANCGGNTFERQLTQQSR